MSKLVIDKETLELIKQTMESANGFNTASANLATSIKASIKGKELETAIASLSVIEGSLVQSRGQPA